MNPPDLLEALRADLKDANTREMAAMTRAIMLQNERNRLADALQRFMQLDPSFSRASDEQLADLCAEGRRSSRIALAVRDGRAALAGVSK